MPSCVEECADVAAVADLVDEEIGQDVGAAQLWAEVLARLARLLRVELTIGDVERVVERLPGWRRGIRCIASQVDMRERPRTNC